MHIGPYSSAPLAGAWRKPHLAVCHVMAALPGITETHVATEIRALRALGHTAVPAVIAQHDGLHDGPVQPGDAELREEAVRLASVDTVQALTSAAANPAGLAAAVGFAQRHRGQPRRALLRSAARLAFTARTRDCTHLHAHSPAAAAAAICAARIAGMTVSFSCHTIRTEDQTGLALALAAANLVVTSSETAARGLRRLAPTADVRAIPTGVSTERFRPHPGAGNGKLLAVGRLVPGKGYHALLLALSYLHPRMRPRLDIVGTGQLERELQALAQDLGLVQAVHFLGPRPSDWIAGHAPLYQGMVCAVQSVHDGVCDSALIAMKEGMAMGLPIVASALPGVREITDETCGRLVAPGDLPGLADALVWLAGLEPEARVRIGSACRARVQARYTTRLQAMRLAAAFADLQP